MRKLCLYFQVHQPLRLRRYRFFDIGNDHYYYDDYANRSIMKRVAAKSYLKTNKLLLELIKENKDKFKVSFSITGIALEQLEQHAPEVIESFKELFNTGCVEILAETYSHSLECLMTENMFKMGIEKHSKKIKEVFGKEPEVFRNTELIYSDKIGETVASMGFKGMLTEGAKHVLGWRSPNFLYNCATNPELKLLIRNYTLSDDIAFRFSDRSWADWPLTAEKYVAWLNRIDKHQELVNLFMDYETFGEHQPEESGIFDFLKALPGAVLDNSEFTFNTPSEVIKELHTVGPIHSPYPISWADEERDLTAWLGNELQEEAFEKLYQIAERVEKSEDEAIKRDFSYLQASDHFYYMSTKWFSDGAVHQYFNPYESPYDAFINYMNVLSDFIDRLDKQVPAQEVQPKRQLRRQRQPRPDERESNNIFGIIGSDFEQLAMVAKKKLKDTLSKTDPYDIALALKGASPEVSERILDSVTKTFSKAIEEKNESLGDKVKLSDISKAQKRILEFFSAETEDEKIDIDGFEKILNYPVKQLRAKIRKVDSETIAVALVSSLDKARERVMKYLSKGLYIDVADKVKSITPEKEDIVKARNKILELMDKK